MQTTLKAENHLQSSVSMSCLWKLQLEGHEIAFLYEMQNKKVTKNTGNLYNTDMIDFSTGVASREICSLAKWGTASEIHLLSEEAVDCSHCFYSQGISESSGRQKIPLLILRGFTENCPMVEMKLTINIQV